MDRKLSRYEELLQREEWKQKRTIIIERDNLECQRCCNSKYIAIKEFKVYKLDKNESFEIQIKRNGVMSKVNSEFKWKPSNDNVVGFCILTKFNSLVAVFELKDVVATERGLKKAINEAGKFALGLLSNESNENPIQKFLISKVNEMDWKFVKNLNVHHTFYQRGKMPWDYSNESLMTLCNQCHALLHQEEVYLYNHDGNKIILTICEKCQGTGYLPEYNYWDNGVCYSCMGSRFTENML